ncbi:MAG: 2-oxoacid:acceptor oxidoreductase family protein [Geobacteraceae bacterium]
MENRNGISALYRIRFHGRGGQGMKTASRILGSAFFQDGFQVQDAPRYGAERRGAPIFAYVRASKDLINERGVIHTPDLVIVADETLLTLPGAGVLHGTMEKSVLLINSAEKEEVLKARLNFSGPVIAFSAAALMMGLHELRFVGAACAGAAARLTGVIGRLSLERAVRAEISHLGDVILAKNLECSLGIYDLLAIHEGLVVPGCGISATGYQRPEWVALPFEAARISVPAVFAPATSV